ncbi:putative glucose-methanol-choline oxidoreductase protein [Phaeoacremonium minimum UCRPA7]|uniref:Putative glucose-methanol-choline oxidoreductase protein n=1 Tax=Phaeoacremonium minimum (strain UCR-PA7) TaxID=1286976 RepID=R8BDK3_PHAM7|nr:putative glucose-methanol-choline oxidoreductase protein [Phaeoacremonium minimum UCRPA7]EON97379.1 putative glucose-methanol-choline oxidoreductase protein [Phaeoacremonium minimum UCRPA7]
MTLISEAPKAFDFIVVGGGTAGCAVAGRLAENPKVSVLIIEAGIDNPGDVDAITTPARAFELRNSKYDWSYKTGMIDRPEYTRIEKPNTRGKVLGGSSCLNYYTWIPGSAATFDDWAPYGGEEWTWKSCKEYLYKARRLRCFHPELKYIGQGGPIPVSHSDLIPEVEPFRNALTKAWVSKGEELTDDVHNGTMRGLWKCTNSIYNGKRSSSWMYLTGKKNVVVMSKTNAKKLIIENGKAVGLEVIGPDERTYSFRAKYEVVVSLGVFESPKLLMLSGIGPDAELKKFGISSVVKSENVGQNLLDHPILPHVFKMKDGFGLDNHLLRNGLEKDAALSAYRWKNKGPLTSGLLELVGLPRIDKLLEKNPEYVAYKKANGDVDPFGPGGQPHFEIDFVPMFSDAFQWHIPTPPRGDYLTVIVDLLRPLSQNGTVTLNSTNPLEQPKVNINFFSNDLDLIAMREGVRFVDDILMNGEGMKDILVEDYPWAMPRHSDEAMEIMIKERSQTGFHPCGTIRMGKDIKQGGVDSKLKVFGVDNLRVIDASVIPVIPDCRIQNSVYMIAEKGADMIKAAYPMLYA